MNTALIMTKLEVVRVFRNRRYTIFTLALPVMMYLIFGNSKDTMSGTNVSVSVYYMVSMATLGAFSGALMGSANRISAERKSGWTRQLRLSALPGWTYVLAKMVASLATTVPAVLIVLALGKFYGGVSMDAWKWAVLAAVIWLGSSTFAALSVALGYRFDPETIQSASMLIYLPMILLGGIYFNLKSGFLHTVATYLPTYRITTLSNQVISAGTFSWSSLGVILVWFVGFIALAVAAVKTVARQES